MGTEGFITRVESRERLKGKAAYRVETPEHYNKLGSAGASRMNPRAITQNMQPAWEDGADLYVLGEAPGEKEDEDGTPFVGPSGRLLRKALGRGMVPAVFDNVCRTRPPKNRTPKWHEIECFRPDVESSIEEAAPRVVLAVGGEAFKWCVPGAGGGIGVARGRRFPVCIGGHVCWVFPVQHPAYILRARDGKDGDEIERVWARDVRQAVRAVREEPPPFHTIKRAMSGIRTEATPDGAVRTIKKYAKLKEFALDIETTHTRPYSDGARILSVALGTHKDATSFLVDHPRAGWSSSDVRRVSKALRWLLTRGRRVVVQNVPFEMEWFAVKLGLSVVRGSKWICTMVQAHTLDERPKGFNLNYLSLLACGLPLKSVSPVNTKRLIDEPIKQLLTYNALDTKYAHVVHRHQWPLLKKEGLDRTYRRRMRGVPALVLAQREGLPIDQDVVQELASTYGDKVKAVERKARRLKVVRAYERRRGRLNLKSNNDLTIVFRDMLGRTEGGSKLGGYSTDESVLKKMDDEPLARLVLKHRNATKILGTYVEPFRVGGKYVYSDGRVHSSWNICGTRTGRTSSDSPNNQNWPKRKDRHVRRMVVAPEGHTLLAIDYGQLEARVIAMASRDKKFCYALWHDLDVHLDWSLRIRKRWSRTYKKRGSNERKFRGDVKNEWVFPQFFGASYKSCAVSLEMPVRIAKPLADEFWSEFSGVKRWQKKVIRDYRKNGYVETLTGFRRHAPIGYNQIINSPIQGTASDIVMDAMARLSARAQRERCRWMQPVLNVHDDLTFIVPDSAMDEAVEVLPAEMVSVPFDFVNVPMTVELEAGKNWYEMDEIGVVRSDQLV